ncbi:ATP-grasp domain-containing protein [Streptomyces sp. NPDC055607]
MMPNDLRIAYLSLRNPHDDFPDVVRHFEKEGITTDLVYLRDAESVRWEDYDLLSLRMMRYFHLEPDLSSRVGALARELGAGEGGSGRVVNPPRLVDEGLDKAHYLPWLAERGVPVVPTRWVAAGTPTTLREVLDGTPWDEAVVKPTLSARGWSAFRVTRSAGDAHHPDPTAEHPHLVLSDSTAKGEGEAERLFRELVATVDVCVQPFVPEIRTEGERSFVFIGGELSHVVHKEVAADGWIAHEGFGGRNTAVAWSPDQERWARRVHELLETRYGKLTYARIDTLPADDGGLQLLECELVAPRLFLAEGDAFGRYTAALKAAASASRTGNHTG